MLKQRINPMTVIWHMMLLTCQHAALTKRIDEVLTTEKGPDSSGRAARMRLRANAFVAGEDRNSRQKDARAPPIATARPPTKAALTETTRSR